MNERLNESLRGVVLDEHVTFTLTELCQACGVETELVVEMVREGVIEPAADDESEWHFYGPLPASITTSSGDAPVPSI